MKTLFDHINEITQNQDANYFDSIDDSDKKSFSNYMINRFLSMNIDWIELVSEVDLYSGQLNKEMLYLLYINILPKEKVFLKYIKPKNEVKYNKEIISLIKKHFEVSEDESIDYLTIFFSSDNGIKSLRKIVSMYGFTEQEINKLLK